MLNKIPTSIPPKYLRRTAWAVAGLLALWLLLWLVVPPLLKSQIEQRGGEKLGRKLSIGAIDFKPWSLELSVSDIRLAKADGIGKQLGIGRIYVDAEMASLWHLAPVMDAITVDAPVLALTHLGAGRYDIDDIVARLNQEPKSPPSQLKFGLYNMSLHGGAVDFTDRSNGERQHVLRDLNLVLPFLSNLDSKREIKVVPRLAFVLNGSVFDSAAEGTPFAQTRKGGASIKIAHLDLKPYLPYIPPSLPLSLKGAVIDADLQLTFAQAAQSELALTGKIKVSDLQVADATGADLLHLDSIQAVLADVRPLKQVIKLSLLEISAPKLAVKRDRKGAINLDFGKRQTAATVVATNEPDSAKDAVATTVPTAATTTATATAPAAANPTLPAAKNDSKADSKIDGKNAAPATPWTFALERLVLHQGEVNWNDDSTATPAKLTITGWELQAQSLAWPMTAPATFESTASMPWDGGAAKISFKGEGSDQQGTAHVAINDLGLALGAPYLAQYLEPGVKGVAEAEFDGLWQAGNFKLVLQRLAVQGFALQAAKGSAPANAAGDLPKFKLLEITDAQFDLGGKSGSIGKVALRAAEVHVRREADGHWMFERWLKSASNGVNREENPAAKSGTVAAAMPATIATAPPSADWQLTLAELVLEEGRVLFDDRSPAKPVQLEISGVKLQMKTLTPDGKQPAPLTLSARIKSGQTEAGTLHYRGSLMWSPLALQGNIEAINIPAHGLAPYFADQLNIELLRADASFKGQLQYNASAAGPEINVRGDAALEEFRSNSVIATAESADSVQSGTSEELLNWKSLNLPGIVLAIKPGVATRIALREAALTDFFARVIVDPSGRINLQDLVKSSQPEPADAVPAKSRAASAAALAASTPVTLANAMPAIVAIGPISLVNGKVYFSDRFIQPNYSADLSQLTGKLSQFSSQPVDGVLQLADLDLRGRAENTAALEITGQLNPLASPLALDIKGKVRDLELPPLSAYSVKFAGHGIERGKLSLDVNYNVKPDGQLSASNNIVLNQLQFGDEVKGAPNSLPVKLAVALLADRNGVIDINLPISGSLNDPQFRLGAVIWKVIGNLVVKALTSPFSLLTGAFSSGGNELSVVSFAPGSSVLAPDAMAGLNKVAAALTERPALKMTVVGSASLEIEREALKAERLKAMLLAEKRRRAVINGDDAAAVTTIDVAEMPALLSEVYKRADIPKPRSVAGAAKEIAFADMEALLLTSISVNEDAIRELALQRGIAVKDYLASQHLPLERLFLGAPKPAQTEPDWKPHAQLSLASG